MKKICFDGFVFLLLYLYTASSENVPNSQPSTYRQKCEHLFKLNELNACI